MPGSCGLDSPAFDRSPSVPAWLKLSASVVGPDSTAARDSCIASSLSPAQTCSVKLGAEKDTLTWYRKRSPPPSSQLGPSKLSHLLAAPRRHH